MKLQVEASTLLGATIGVLIQAGARPSDVRNLMTQVVANDRLWEAYENGAIEAVEDAAERAVAAVPAKAPQ